MRTRFGPSGPDDSGSRHRAHRYRFECVGSCQSDERDVASAARYRFSPDRQHVQFHEVIDAAGDPSRSMVSSLTAQYARPLAGIRVLINAACPGYVATDFTGFAGSRPPEQGA